MLPPDGSAYLVSDAANEKKFKFTLSTSLQKAAKNQLLAGFKVHVTKSVKPEPNQMRGEHIPLLFVLIVTVLAMSLRFVE